MTNKKVKDILLKIEQDELKEKKENYNVTYAYIDEKKSYVKITSTHVNRRGIEKAQQTLKELRNAGFLSNSDTKTEQSKQRTKKRIFDILRLNLNDTSRFVTLTYKENEQDYKKAYKDFNNMLTIFNRKNEKLKYLVVKEHQKRGAIHYHMITFNNHKVKWRNYWKHGNVNIKNIDDIIFPEKIANYFVKYLGKNKKGYKSVDVGFRVLGYSRNLIKEKKVKLHYRELHDMNYMVYRWGDMDKNGNRLYFGCIVSKDEYESKVLPF